MAKKGKIGKQRKDNFYKLAKIKGFRSRAAFKLIQLNRKFQFLENSRVCIDLCAAPGGWLQVASEYMPVSSVIVGVDLVPIVPVRNVITFQSDITTKECAEKLENSLAGWKADIVLHDGAPNVGKNWLHDAYGQNVLVVNALKIACSQLTKGGWFITKIFRSADYNSLLWVFGKLFGKVHATKPQASRSESAEIFVVCQNYKSPAQIDPKFFDPSALFADISDFDDVLKKQKADLLKPASKVKKAKAVGYEDGDALKTTSDIEFVTTSNHMEYLAQCHQILISNQDILNHEATDDEIKECCKDIKVLGRKELLKLLKWRRTLRKDLTAKLMKALKEGDYEEGNVDEFEEDNFDSLTIKSGADTELDAEPELQLDDIELQMDLDKRKEQRRLKKKEEKRVKDYQQRVQYGMINQGDVLIEEENDLFNLSRIRGKKHLDKIDDAEPDELVEDTQDPTDLEAEQKKQKKSVTFSRVADVQYFDLDQDYDSDEPSHPSDDPILDKSSDEPAIKAAVTPILKEKKGNSALDRLARAKPSTGGGLLQSLMDVNQSMKRDASIIRSRLPVQIDLHEAHESDMLNKLLGDKTNDDNDEETPAVDLSRFDDGISSDSEEAPASNGLNEMTDDSDSDDDEERAKPKKKQIKLDPEGLALATMMVSSNKMRKDIEDEGWNRFAQADSHLAPKWFREDEAKHCRRNIPVSAELVKEYKQKLKDIDAKPIKKVMQAKARQKRRAMRKMEKVKKKVDSITNNDDMTQKEKINQIKSVYKNATKTKKKEVKVVVARKGVPAKKPTKGKYKMVDSRLKKDMRAKERREKKKGKKGGSGGFKKSGRGKKFGGAGKKFGGAGRKAGTGAKSRSKR